MAEQLLIEGVEPLPSAWTASRQQALEEAEQKCQSVADSVYPTDPDDCVAAIRQLKDKQE